MFTWWKKSFLIYLIIFCACLTGYAQNDDIIEGYKEEIDREYREAVGENPDSPEVEEEEDWRLYENGPLFRFAWEQPSYSEDYELLKRKPWIEPNGLVEAFVSLRHLRTSFNEDTYVGIGYISFRPFVLDFGDFSLAFGASYIGRLARKDDEDQVQNQQVNGLNAVVLANDIETKAYQHGLNFSVLASFPKHSMQFVFDIGYARSRIRETIDPIVANVANGAAILTFDEFQYKQHDEGLFVSLAFLKSFDRDYFDFISLFVYGGVRTQTTLRNSNALLTSQVGNVVTRSGKQELPFVDAAGIAFADPQQPDEFQLGVISFSSTVRIYNYVVPNDFFKNRGIGFNLYNLISHRTGELLGEDFYGIRYKLGGTITLFDAISFRANYVWEFNNDQHEGVEIAVDIRISGIAREAASLF